MVRSARDATVPAASSGRRRSSCGCATGRGTSSTLEFQISCLLGVFSEVASFVACQPSPICEGGSYIQYVGFCKFSIQAIYHHFFSVFELVVSPRRAPVPRIARLLFCLLMPPKNHYPNFSDIILSGTPFRAIASPAGFRTGVNEPRVTERKGTDGQRGGSCFYYDGMRVRTKGCWV